MSEIKDFIAKAERFLKSAGRLLELEDYDSYASRCYHAMFYVAEAALMTRGISPASHRAVITLFGKHFVQAGVFPADLGRTPRKAYDVRLVGDYAVDAPVGREEAETLLGAARRFVNQVRIYLEEQERKDPLAGEP